MNPNAETNKKLDEIEKVLASLRGVKHTFYLTGEMRNGLEELEIRYPPIGPLTVQNDGVLECLKRRHVACIVKDNTFRGPPHPTVVLMNENGAVIGRELLLGEKVGPGEGSKTLFLGKDFVLFVGKESGKGSRFVLPPVEFKEVEDVRGTACVVSSSPSTTGDLFLRKKAGLDDDPKLASILIGFDLCGP
ncbi:MAG: hypothetical protein ABIE25_07590 [Thermoplasmatota archaeon]|nr:hypothetical protein [Candidatus Thermoplasmatota archaeon]MBU1914204.1 hypothetical protein [Candidatus Thermoplasmatota archaeon]